jgi:DNA helicase II / ATP-dependent DNA helicase PcrA
MTTTLKNPALDLTPTPEQEAIVEAARLRSESLMIAAYAGCSKTTTLGLISKALPQTTGLALAFNVKAKKELEKKLSPNFTILTLNGLGHRAWKNTIGRTPRVDKNKLASIVTATLKDKRASQDDWIAVRELTSLAMHRGIIPSGMGNGLTPDEDHTWFALAESRELDADDRLITWARACLKESIKQSFNGVVSYDDQVYMPAVFSCLSPKFPLVMVDEAQDLSPVNHVQVKKAASERLIVVGDPAQAIYQFRGASERSMEQIRMLRDEWVDLGLTVTFRCPIAVVERQRRRVPDYKADVGNVQGRVIDHRRRQWSSSVLKGRGQTAILCRNNAPLLALAMKLFQQQIPCTVLGSDIGRSLIRLSKKLLAYDLMRSDDCIRAIINWSETQETQYAADRADCLIAVLEHEDVNNAGELRKALARMFEDKEYIVILSTGHKAKGLEWDTVIHLDPWRIPSRYATTEDQLQQERNLRYVIETRTKNILVLADLRDFESQR